MNVLRIPILFAACALLRPIAAQDKPPIEYVFSGFAWLSDCDKFPAPSVSIGPSMNRYKTHDALVIHCDTSSHTISLTFRIDSSVPPAHGFQAYSFRWGAPGRIGHIVAGGQLPNDLQRCVAFMDLLKANIPQTLASSTSRSPHWSAGCHYDDAWGISMEIYLSGDDPNQP